MNDLLLPPLAAEKIFHIGSFGVTNSLINSTVTVILFALFAFFLNRAMKKGYTKNLIPTGIVNFFESILEVIISYIDGVTKDRKKSLKFLPIVGTLFLFILISNWLGQFPGTGSFVRYLPHEGHIVGIPVLRPATSDLNLTLAMALFAVISSHLLGVFAIGFFKYANKFIKLGDIYNALKSMSPMKVMVAVIEFFVGLIEVFSEAAKVVSLSLRLFGNIFAGEVLMTVMAWLIAYFIPLPFIALEILVGIVQATVFSMLTLVYLSIATTDVRAHDDSGRHEEGHAHVEPVTGQ
jgi:F-type H+-transporting ATPase subunit a